LSVLYKKDKKRKKRGLVPHEVPQDGEHVGEPLEQMLKEA